MPRCLVLPLLAAALPAQSLFAPADDWFVRLQLPDLPGFTAAFEQSALGAIARSDDFTAFWQGAAAAQQAAAGDYRTLEQYCSQHSLLTADELLNRAFFDLQAADVAAFALYGYFQPGGQYPMPQMLVTLTPQQRAEGRLTATCQQLCRDLAASIDTQRSGEQKLGGFPADVFALKQKPENQDWLPENYGSFAIVHLPGQFVFGSGSPAEHGSFVDKEPPAGAPVVEMAVRFGAMPGGGMSEMQQLGLDPKGVLSLSSRFVGRLLQNEAGLDVAPGGLADALVAGKAKLPRQPLPDGALLQLRLSVDVDKAATAAAALLGEIGVTADLKQPLAVLDGGLALGVAAPGPGGLIPRIWLSASLADPQAFARLLQQLPQGAGAPTLEPRKLAGRDCTLLRVPGMPAGLSPCFCVVDGTVHAAETTQSLVQLLRQLDGDAAALAMDVGEAPLPQGDGPALPSFDLRYDLAAIYRAYHEHWLPPLRLMLQAEAGSPFVAETLLQPLVDPDLLPPSELIDEHVHQGRAVVRRQGDHLVYQELGEVGGPILSPVLGFYGGAFAFRFEMNTRWRLLRLQNRVETHQLEQLWAALQKHEKLTGKKAQSLAELAAAGHLQSDALLRPGDASPDAIPFTDGDGKPQLLKSSYRLVPGGVDVSSYEGQSKLLAVRRPGIDAALSEREQMFGYGELVFLDDQGTVREEYGDDDFRQALRRAGMSEAERKADEQQETQRQQQQQMLQRAVGVAVPQVAGPVFVQVQEQAGEASSEAREQALQRAIENVRKARAAEQQAGQPGGDKPKGDR